MESIKFKSAHRQVIPQINMDQIIDDRIDIINPSIETLTTINQSNLIIDIIRASSKQTKTQPSAQKLLKIDLKSQKVFVKSYEGGTAEIDHWIPAKDLTSIWVVGKNAKKLLSLLTSS